MKYCIYKKKMPITHVTDEILSISGTQKKLQKNITNEKFYLNIGAKKKFNIKNHF